MSFEPKTKVELDPPKDDVISLDYLSKCDGKFRLESYSSTTARSDVPITGTNPDYPTYVAIKGTVFDVTGNKAYGPEGSYKGMSAYVIFTCSAQLLTHLPHSVRRQGRISRPRTVISQARGVPR